jgi:hypothetical protein
VVFKELHLESRIILSVQVVLRCKSCNKTSLQDRNINGRQLSATRKAKTGNVVKTKLISFRTRKTTFQIKAIVRTQKTSKVTSKRWHCDSRTTTS